MPSADAAFPMIAGVDVGRFAARALVNPPPASEVVDLLGPPIPFVGSPRSSAMRWDGGSKS